MIVFGIVNRRTAVSCVVATAAAALVLGAAATRAGAAEPHPSIYLAAVATGHLREVVVDPDDEGPPLSLSWTPDAGALVFGHASCDGCAEIRLLHLAPRSPGLGLIVGQGRAPSLSRDGTTLLFIGQDGGIYSAKLAGGPARRLLPGVPGAGGIDQPRFSPEGRRIAFMRAQPNGKWSIDVSSVAGGGERRLTPLGISAANPAWSPDGTTVAFSAQAAGGRWRIELVRRDGRNLRVVPGSGGSDSFPTWSPDGKRIAFVRQGRKGDSIFIADVSGGHARRLTPNTLDAIQPAWSPRGDQIAFVVNTPVSD